MIGSWRQMIGAAIRARRTAAKAAMVVDQRRKLPSGAALIGSRAERGCHSRNRLERRVCLARLGAIDGVVRHGVPEPVEPP
ncbi:MAG: hypothetical protein K2Y37_19480, partial [Pirellulales bacterium]|nr:hypothetical protein [Pirellulales bacterium]